MTIQALVFMHQLRKTQITEDGTVWLDEDHKKMQTFVNEGTLPHVIDLSKKWRSIFPMLMYLKSKGLVEQTSLRHFNLSYDGFHYTQTIITRIINFLLTSIFVPIVVAFITSLVTSLVSLWLTGAF